jgi:hypothetical protein
MLARSRVRHLGWAIAAAGTLGCSAPLSNTECEAFANHIIDLATATANAVEVEVTTRQGQALGMADPVRARGEARRADLVRRCTTSPRTAYECAMAADSLAALRECNR